MKSIIEIANAVGAKLYQYLVSMAGGLLLAFESSIPFFIPCLIITLIDIWAACRLSMRVKKKYPGHSDGKFKSEYKNRLMRTMLLALACIVMANYVDVYIIKSGDFAVRWMVGFFLFYQAWSVLENWSSENDNKLARALQRIMVNKAERHLDVPLSDIMLNEQKPKDDGGCE